MPKANSSLNMLIVAAVVALGIGYCVPQTFSQKAARPNQGGGTPPGADAAGSPKPTWAASAPGRVEPMGGEVRISGQAPGRIIELLVGSERPGHGRRPAGELADDELSARVHAARAEVAARKRDRDNENVNKAAQDRRTAEDSLANAERRSRLPAPSRIARQGATERQARSAISTRRERREAGTEKLEQSRSALQKALANDTSVQTRLEAALTAARAELTLAEAALERARIRAPSNGHVLQVNARVGEIVAPSPEKSWS